MKKVAFITGTSQGIGKSLAELLLQKNYMVFGYSRTNNIKHPNFTFTNIDLSNLEKVQEFTFPNLVNSTFLLINNAGSIGEIIPLSLKKENAIIREYNLNIIAPTLLCSKFIRSYIDQDKQILNIGSGAANNPIASWSTYCSAKSALDMLTEVICVESYKKLKIFSVHPGIVDTKMQQEIRQTEDKHFPLVDKFRDYHNNNELENPIIAAKKVYYIIQNFNGFTKNILSIRDIDLK